MADKTPLRAVYDNNSVATGLAEYQTGETVGVAHGGTGATFDWNIARDLGPMHQFLMGGGLTPGNVGQVVREIGPWAVDVSSGVETDGVKDPEKISAFVRNGRS